VSSLYLAAKSSGYPYDTCCQEKSSPKMTYKFSLPRMKLEFSDCICTLRVTSYTTKENTTSADTSKKHSVILSLNGQKNNKKRRNFRLAGILIVIK